VATTSSGETVEGPVCAEVSVNALRYGADLSTTFTYTAGPTLTSVFPSSFAPGSGQEAAPPTSLEQAFRLYERRLIQVSLQLLQVQQDDLAAGAALDSALRTLKNLVVQSDDTFLNYGAAGVLGVTHSDVFQGALTQALNQQSVWTSTDQIVTALRAIELSLNGLAFTFPANTETVTTDYCLPTNINKLGWTDWDTKCRDAEFKQQIAAIDKLLADAARLTSDGDQASTVAKKLGVASYWKTMSDALTADVFVRQAEADCPTLFNRNSQIAFKLTLVDRSPTFDLQASTSQPRDNLIVVQCSSRFALSAGVAFSAIPNPEFAIVKGQPTGTATTATNQFGILSDPSVHPVPIAAVHARLVESLNQRVALHASFAIGINTRSQSAGGSSPEFLLGPSVSFLRTVFLTVGAEIGKNTGLAGGFHAGDVVPTDITSVQVTTSYQTHWGVAVTFTKP
jgi:hypothetical protein